MLSLLVSTAAVSSQLVVAVADRVPNLDVKATCRESSIRECLSMEQAARQKLIEEWPHFTADEKKTCTFDERLAGPPSYVGWLTCLEINADVKRDVRAAESAPTGASPGDKTSNEPSLGVHRSPPRIKQRHASQR